MKMNVYPNPAQYTLNVSIPTPLQNESMVIRIINIGTGQVELIKQNATSINVQSLSSGMYILDVRSTHFYGVQKWIKK